MKYAFSSAVLSLLWLLALPSFAASGRADYDLDDDGLIEINDWADLNEVRNNPKGKALYGSSVGCPSAGCNGFELSVDLNFDTNGDGKLDASDSYWNEGKGWVAIGSGNSSFNAIFEGNGHLIRNLMINRPAENYQGLFGSVLGAQLRNLGLTGRLMAITGQRYVGGLAGYVSSSSSILNAFATGAIMASDTSNSYVGGLVGSMSGGTITGCFSAGSVQASSYYVGGLIGYGSSVTVQSAFSSAVVVSSGGSYIGGLSGFGVTIDSSYSVGKVTNGNGLSGYSGSTTNSYWATDTSGQTRDGNSSTKPATLAQLKCPTAADNTSCLSGTTLYAGWGNLKDSKGNPYWNFGTNAQLPGLVLNGVVYRDGDGDGVLDIDDVWPANAAAAYDSDGDGAPDEWNTNCDSACQAASGLVLDQIPNNAAAILDADWDGKPDAWAVGCNTACQNASGLVLDSKLNDSDNDGIADNLDTDINNDGITDADSDHDGLIDISTWAQLDAVRNNLNGTGRQLTAGGVVDSSGCPMIVKAGVAQRICSGYELTQDLNFDTNGDGKLDASDSYWNTGTGWVPIGAGSSTPFNAIFEGNGRSIHNLMINRPKEYYQALFGVIKDANIRNLGLRGQLMSITGDSYVAGLAAYSRGSSQIKNCFVVGSITASYTGDVYSGGLVGYFSGGIITGSFTAGSVQALGNAVGGLVGYGLNTNIQSVFSSTSVTGNSYVGGIWGYGGTDVKLEGGYAIGKVRAEGFAGGGVSGGYNVSASHSYWASDSSGQMADGSSPSATPATLAQLKCPTAADNTSCLTDTKLYEGWAALKDAQGNAYWSFGTNTDLPGLVLNGVTYRDNDGDGVLNDEDKWPTNAAAGYDSDNDGAPDQWSAGCDSTCQAASGLVLDQMPNSAAAILDADLDGKPDAWAASCNATCQSASGLVLDSKLNDVDNDGIADNLDTDINNDGTTDADSDHDGLIEVSTWAQLNAIRNSPSGTGRQLTATGPVDSSGCPATIKAGAYQRICSGYELTQDFNFDINGDDKLDASDSYWNGGSGWSPIDDFNAIFEGNSHVIRNLMINRPDNNLMGLFALTSGATLRNIGLTGKLMSITGSYNVGALAGRAKQTLVQNCFTTGAIVGAYNGIVFGGGNIGVGGLVGDMTGGSVIGSFNTGSVRSAGSTVGGLVGFASNTQLRSVFSSASVSGLKSVGAILGNASNASVTAAYAVGRVTGGADVWALSNGTISNSYWAKDLVGVSDGSTAIAAMAAQLKCPTAANNTSCLSGTTLYSGWDKELDPKGNNYWNFGTTSQLPGLLLNGVIYRDGDGDGYLDSDDVWPTNPAAGLDTDGDGAPDRWAANCNSACQAGSGLVLDQFPASAAVSVDLDLDGKPDAWNASCNSACQTTSVLVLDTKLNDFDNDGIVDSQDQDLNGDGVVDADANHNGLIEISTLAQLDAVRYNLKGLGRQLSASGAVDSSGCGITMVNGALQRGCKGYELTQNLDFDTNGNGQVDSSDTYWNGGLGWVAIGSSSAAFSALFDAKGYVIRNLMINRPTADYQGLFGYTDQADIRNLGVTGKLMSITGKSFVGGLIAQAQTTQVSNCFSAGAIVSTNTSSAYAGGLVGYLNGGQITGSSSNGTVQAQGNYIGGLVGLIANSQMIGNFSSGSVQSKGSYVGGLVGSIESGQIIGSFSTGSVQTQSSRVGGLAGNVSNATFTAVYSTASVTGSDTVGGLVGQGNSLILNGGYAVGKLTTTSAGASAGGLAGLWGSVNNSYWATDASYNSVGTGLTGSNYNGATLAQLKCPTAPDNTTCVAGTTLYKGWGDLKDAKGNAYWDFGTSSQLPVLVFNGIVMRDTDSDGLLDSDDPDIDNDGVANAQDMLPLNAAASVDTDGDGSPDSWNAGCDSTCQTNSGLKLDVWPNNAAVALDNDGDGIPDAWSPNCNTACQTASGLTLDAFPALVSVSVDTDGDGVPDAWNPNCDASCKTTAQAAMVRLDAFPTKAAVSVDADGDGVPDSWNASCNTACQTASGLTLDAFPTKVAASVDTDGDGFPNAWNASCNTVCQTASGLTLDALPNNAAASVDTDGDGMPDAWNSSCNTSCQSVSGLVLDAFPSNKAASVDTDGDGSPNSWNLGCDTTCQTNSGLKLDAFPTNKAASIDSDGDGVPDSWNASCNASCQIASLLVIDQLPNNKAASVDTDGDGSPDTWNLSCNTSCKTASGLTLDAFPTNKAATLDADGDGRPDAWNASCNTACQASSGLTLDILLNDKDNDGVPDASDPDNTRDNGKPTIVAVPEDINIAATGATTLVTLVKADVSAFDAVDSQLALEVSNGSQLLTIDANNQVALPSGALKLRWVAIDKAGNRSDAVEQLVNIYPQVQFTKTQDKVGEKTTAKLALSFSGAVPVYPVKLTFSWVNSESTAVTADVNTTVETGIDLSKLSLTLNNAEELAKAALGIPVLEDALVENDETLVFEITAASAGKDQPFSLPIVDAGKRTVLTITELNLAPTAVLSMTQAGKVTSLIDPKAGVVDVTSVVTDLNGKDTHSYVWDTTGLPVSGLDKATYSFDPLKMANGSYSVSVTATDNGLPPLSSEKVTLKFEVKGQSSSSSSSSSKSSSSTSSNSSAGSNSSSSVGTGTSPETGGGSGGGGGSIDFLLLFVLCSLGFRFRVAKH